MDFLELLELELLSPDKLLEYWRAIDEDDNDDPSIYRTCEICGGEFWDGGTSCTCSENERWYKGRRHCLIVSPLSKLKTVCVQWDDGSRDIVPVRMCWRKPLIALTLIRQAG